MARGSLGATPFLELDCDAVVDGHEVLRLIAESEQKLPYEGADAFIVALREAMQAGHATVDPRTGGPLCLGRLSPGNTLYNARGRFWLVGFGRNFPVEKDNGLIDGEVPFHQAPELSTGGAPSPMATTWRCCCSRGPSCRTSS